jgi:hypothetical protein
LSTFQKRIAFYETGSAQDKGQERNMLFPEIRMVTCPTVTNNNVTNKMILKRLPDGNFNTFPLDI